MPTNSSDMTAILEGSIPEYLRAMGPSWVAGSIAAGPASMASLIAAGAGFDYTLLWVVLLSPIAGALAQYLAMRLGLLTEAGIVTVVEQSLGEKWAWLLVADVVIAAGVAQLVIMKTVATVSATITGIGTGTWGVVWAVIVALGLAGRGYRLLEIAAKLLVSGVVIAFVASAFVVPLDVGQAVNGLVPTLPGGTALVAAGILGGAVHITLITMHSYTMQARDWSVGNYGLATFDVIASMLVAFGIYSIAIFLVAASVLSDPSLSTVGAAQALGPLVGESAKWLFLLGLGGAAVSTLGGNTIVPPFLVADKLGWQTSVEDTRYRGLVAAFALLSAPGAFIGGRVLGQLVLVLALGTIGTPFAIAIVLYLLNADAVPASNSILANVGGGLLLVVSGTLAANFVREQLGAGVGPLSGAVLVFAVILGLATFVVIGKFLREEVLTS
ncbi:divalent metal cation transporter [Halodesulfurarchaeum sp. HSR-GB]|uniref:NRAMP family divalent metal transporter n=1 Tax=Halodesulfurarchaeum sp. HSR-GB TaxID=3074077 RepID=UPI00285DC5C9|nr:divalent metal cation transporter [Halodesulfurarchaeum sp. HSR-GB]MDR5657778.1 divalent metal cation transporter [Halodesulfurarchaeum sp. HSR-GB]